MVDAYVVSKNENGSGNVRFAGQIIVPKGYRVQECGVIWTGRNTINMPNLYTWDGNTFTAIGKKNCCEELYNELSVRCSS